MPYVSARYAPPDLIADPMLKEGSRRVIATDENGLEWWLTDDSDVGDWLRYLRNGGNVEPYVEPSATKKEKSDG